MLEMRTQRRSTHNAENEIRLPIKTFAALIIILVTLSSGGTLIANRTFLTGDGLSTTVQLDKETERRITAIENDMKRLNAIEIQTARIEEKLNAVTISTTATGAKKGR